jgi:NAD(P)-dependent dehydrogenase (short-subunit alcohol dehydrogenase family)
LAKRLVGDETLVIGVSRSRCNWKNARKAVKGHKNFYLRQADASKENDVKKLVNYILKKFKRIDIVVNSAGYVNSLSKIEDISLNEFNRNISGNLISTFLICKYTLPIIKKQGKGIIINVSSMAGKRGVPRIGAYSAAKSGVIALSQCIAKENHDAGIKCVTVCPGGMNTSMRSKLFGLKDAKNQQSADFVAGVISDIICNRIKMKSGEDIIIRHGRVTAVNALPGA